jgi:hypothetical protein
LLRLPPGVVGDRSGVLGLLRLARNCRLGIVCGAFPVTTKRDGGIDLRGKASWNIAGEQFVHLRVCPTDWLRTRPVLRTCKILDLSVLRT